MITLLISIVLAFGVLLGVDAASSADRASTRTRVEGHLTEADRERKELKDWQCRIETKIDRLLEKE